MHRLSYIYIMAVMALLTSCIYDEELPESNVDGGEAYISVAINQPAPSASRADDLEHGEEAEYTINDAYLLLFENDTADPATAEFVGGFTLWDLTDGGTPDDVNHISRVYKTNLVLYDFLKVAGKHYYAIVIANTNGAIYPGRSSVHYYNTEGTYTQWTGKTFSEFCQIKLNNPAGKYPGGHLAQPDGSNILMTSALLYNVTGAEAASATPLSMAIDVTDKIKEQPLTDAEKADPDNYATFYVERAAAKVSVKLTNSSMSANYSYNSIIYNVPYKYTRHTDTYDREESYLAVGVDGWALVNLNDQTFVMRQWDDSWPALVSNGTPKYRFVGTSRETTGVNLYRTYFCKSPWYSEGLGTHISTASYTRATPFWNPEQVWTETDCRYCYENTMAAEKMMVKNATHVVVRAFYNINPDTDGDNGDFYIIMPATGNIDDYKTEFFDIDHLKAALRTLYPDIDGDIGFSAVPDYGSQCTVVSVEASGLDDTEKAARVSTINSSYKIYCYKGGYAYYLIPISHFGNEFTIWNNNETPTPVPINASASEEVNIANSYPEDNRDDNYLGRWGVVRNTWYELSITGVKGVGSPFNYCYYPELVLKDPTPLDYYNAAIECTLQVKNWTLRDQTVELDTP